MDSEFFTGKKVLVTGGSGFIGKRLVARLKERKCLVFYPENNEYDLRKEEDVKRLFEKLTPDIVFHLAGNTGDVRYLKEHCGQVIFDNIMMNTLVLHYAHLNGVQKFIGIGSSYEYPKGIEAPYKEEDLWKGEVEESSASYIHAKRMMLVQSQEYRKQYGFNAIHLLLTTVYGEGANPNMVIPSLIKRSIDAKEQRLESIEVWGTGEATRDFLYVDDAVEAMICAAEKYNCAEPVNIGSGREIKIRELATSIGRLLGYAGKIIFDSTKPEGPKRVFLDTFKAERQMDFKAKTIFEQGLRKTIESIMSLNQSH
jgi:GDP-L-fucose synthase